LLFFGNPYQNLSEFVLQDLGLLRYEKYAIDHAHRIFTHREDVIQYQLLIDLREQLAGAADADALRIIAARLPAPFAEARMERRRVRLCNQLAYAFERNNEQAAALELYCQHAHP